MQRQDFLFSSRAWSIGIAMILVGNVFGSLGCSSKNSSIALHTPSEMAEAVLSGSVNSTEIDGTQSYYDTVRRRGLFATIQDWLVTPSFAATACPTISTATCSLGDILMTYTNCSFGSSSTVWNGNQNIHISGGCQPIDLTHFNSETFTRSFGAGTTETTSAGVITTLDTTTASTSGWDTANVTGVSNGIVAAFRNTTGDRTLAISGIHLHGKDVASGNAVFDYTLSSGSLSVIGTGTSRTIALGGQIAVQENASKYTGQAHITTALSYAIASCCHPSSGVLTTSLSGSRVGTEVLTFTGGTTGHCGTATYTDSSGSTTDVTLTHCY